MTFYDRMYNCVSDAYGDVAGQRKLIQSVNFLQRAVQLTAAPMKLSRAFCCKLSCGIIDYF